MIELFLKSSVFVLVIIILLMFMRLLYLMITKKINFDNLLILFWVVWSFVTFVVTCLNCYLLFVLTDELDGFVFKF